MDATTKDKCISICISRQQLIKGLQPAMGHGIDTNGQRIRAANRCRCLFATTYEGKQVGDAAGRTRGVPRNSKASSKPAQGKRWSRKRRERARTEREREAPKSVRQHFVLSTRDDFVFFAFPFYSPKRGRFAFNS